MLTVLTVLALYGLALETYLVSLTWLLAWRLRNAAIIDPVWAFGFLPLFLLSVLFSGAGGIRIYAFTGLVALWSVRLSFHLFRRWWTEWPHEDKRYAVLRTQWGHAANRKFFFFFLLQGVLAWLLALPWLAILCDASEPLRALEWVGLCLGVFALLGEALSDGQLARFRANPASKGKILNTGLWRYSRHPNYFFEWLVWCAFAIFASASPLGWTAWISAAAMLYFLLRFTGIPATEAAMKKSRGAEYEDYLRRTSAFVPLPPRAE